MESVVLVIHLFLAIGIIALVLVQRSEGGGLGIGGGGGGMGNLATAQGTATLLTRLTAILATAFFATSLLLGILAGTHSPARQSIMDQLDKAETSATAPIEVEGAEAGMPEQDKLKTPSAPISE